MQYRKKQTEYAADQIDTGARDNYKLDIFPAIRWLSKACKKLLADKIRNCWETTSIVLAYDCDTLAEDNETASDIEKYARAVDPQSRRITMSDVMNREQEIKVTRNVSETDALANIHLPDKVDA